MKTREEESALTPGTTQPTAAEGVPLGGPVIRAGGTLGRYTILEQLGSGGMGEVYAAYDPQLDRKVALKVLRADLLSGAGSAEGRERLVREAQALAKLSHPNVVAVHDAGTVGDELFIAMDFIDGVTLHDWLTEKPRTWREVVELLKQAGAGLAAAHAAGLVHRDFKPQNVLLGKNGRVYVLDFGLARPVIIAPPETLPLPGAPERPRRISESEMAATSLTQPGALMGTPGYMSPEQLRGKPTSVATDQFAFCVTLYQALYGRRPFHGAAPTNLLEQMEARRPLPRPKDSKVPTWLHRIIERGLSPSPEQRFPSMDALLRALSKDPGALRRRALAAAVGLALGVAGMAGWAAVQQREAAVCRGATRKWAGVWDAPSRAAIAHAFEATGAPFAQSAWATVEHGLDSYSHAWTEMYVEACEATSVRREQSAELLDLRMDCLDKRLREVRALTFVFAQADAVVVTNAPKAVDALSPLGPCADASALLSQGRAGPGRAPSPQVEKLQAAFAEGKAYFESGKAARAVEVLEPAVAEAASLGIPSLEAEGLMLEGYAQVYTTDFKGAEKNAHRAAQLAERSGDPELLARAWLLVIRVVGLHLERHEEALLWAGYARAAIARAGGSPALEGQLLTALAKQQIKQTQYVESVQSAQKALELLTAALGESNAEVADVHKTLAFGLSRIGRAEEGLEHGYRALAIQEARLGPNHPLLAGIHGNIATTLAELGRLEDSELEQLRSLKIFETAFGSEHLAVSTALLNLGSLYTEMGRYADAERACLRALAIVEKMFGPDHPRTGLIVYNLAENELLQGHGARALDLYSRGLAVQEKSEPTPSLDTADFETGIGEARLVLGKPMLAVPSLERSLAIRKKLEGPPRELGRTRFALARALWDARLDRRRALELAKSAREPLEKAGLEGKARRKALEAWLAERER